MYKFRNTYKKCLDCGTITLTLVTEPQISLINDKWAKNCFTRAIFVI